MVCRNWYNHLCRFPCCSGPLTIIHNTIKEKYIMAVPNKSIQARNELIHRYMKKYNISGIQADHLIDKHLKEIQLKETEDHCGNFFS